jgi:dTDP-4-dehydrorhamnose reductase
MCAERDVRLLFTSSEQVFDGLQENYKETDSPAPGNEYGRQKLEAETAIREICPDAAVVRISVLFGQSGNTARCFLQQWLDAWQKMLPVTAFNDEIRSFLSVRSAVNALYLLWQKDASGIFHVGGATPLSRYDFAQMAKHTFRLPAAPLICRSQKEVELPTYRPPRLVMSNSKITELGFSAEEAEAALLSLAKEININTSLSLN